MRLLHKAQGSVGAFAAEEAILLAFERVVVDEEFFQFPDPFGGKVAEAADICIHVVGIGDGDEAVVADFLFAVELFALDYADQASAYGDSREGGFIHKQQDVDGVAVGRDGLGYETEIPGEDHSGGKNRLEGEDALFGIVGKFVAASGGGFDDDLEEIVFLVDGLEAGGVGKGFHRFSRARAG